MQRGECALAAWLVMATAGFAIAQEPSPSAWFEASLHCAETEGSAREALDALRQRPVRPFGLPLLDAATKAHLSARQLDRVLRDLARIYRAHPPLRLEIERLVLSWDFCEVFYEQRGWDLVVLNGGPRRVPTASPEDGWLGFRAWGFEPNPERIVPTLFERNTLFPSQRLQYSALAFSEQCFPDPMTGRTPFDVDETAATPHRVSGAVTAEDQPAVEVPPEPSCAAEAETPSSDTLRAYEVTDESPVASPIPFVSQLAPLPAVSNFVDTPTTVTPASSEGLGLSGSLFESYATGSQRASVGGRVSYSPLPSTYVRVGIVQRVNGRPRGGPTYTWGIGYNDWHTGTCSLELNNWSATPIRRFDIRGAQVDVGCKVPLPRVLGKYLGMSLGATFTLNGAPSYGVSFSLSPGGHWYVNVSFRYAPDQPTPLSWSYGFGNWNYKPYTLSLGYSNGGPNELMKGNFDKNGSLTMAWSWAL